MQWLPMITRSARRRALPDELDLHGVPAATLSSCWPMVMKPSAWLKAVTAPEPLAIG